jgi:VIT1/CCC1 family predicted Fe2+/Mn2+ transporter
MVGVAYLAAAIVPLWPYAVLPLMRPALVTGLACTLVALFALGLVSATVARQSWLRGGIQVLLIGAASAGVGFAIGRVVTAIVS